MRAVADQAKAAPNASEQLAEAFRSAIFAQDSAEIHSLLPLEPLLATQTMCIYGDERLLSRKGGSVLYRWPHG